MSLFNFFYQTKKKRTSYLTETEVKVINLLLSGEDYRFKLMLNLIEKSQGFERKIVNNQFLCKPTFFIGGEEFLIEEIEQDIRSSSIFFNDKITNLTLEMFIKVGKPGMFLSLEGKVKEDLLWPKEWDISSYDYKRLKKNVPYLILPDKNNNTVILKEICEWFKVSEFHMFSFDKIRFRPPLDKKIIRNISNKIYLNNEQINFYSISNGISISEYEILGLEDLYDISLPDGLRKYTVIVDLREMGVIAIPLFKEDENIYWFEIGSEKLDDGKIIANSFKEFVFKFLTEFDSLLN